MPLTKTQKQKIIQDLREDIAKTKAIFLIGITGLKVKDISNLRKKLKAVGAKMTIAKKTLAKIAFKENKLEFEKDKFKEEVALIFGFEDEILPAKTAYQFSRENEKLKILGGFVENKFREAVEITALAKLPSREELLFSLFYCAKSPLFKINNILGKNLSIFSHMQKVKS